VNAAKVTIEPLCVDTCHMTVREVPGISFSIRHILHLKPSRNQIQYEIQPQFNR